MWSTQHVETDSWKKHPEKSPEWYKELQKKKEPNEASGSNVEMSLARVEIPDNNYYPQDFLSACQQDHGLGKP